MLFLSHTALTSPARRSPISSTSRPFSHSIRMAAALIKKTVTGEYGYHHRDTPDLTGKTAVITGGTNGIGLSFSRTLYTRGASIIVIGHSASTGKDGVAYIKSGKLEDAPQDYQNGERRFASDDSLRSVVRGIDRGRVE